MDSQKQFSPNENEQQINSWEESFQIHKRRKNKTDSNIQQSPSNQSNKSVKPVIKTKPQSREQLETNTEVLGEYLTQWQIQHNISVEENKAHNAYDDVDNDANVVLSEEWIEAQHLLQGDISSDGIKKVDTVWYNPKHQVIETTNNPSISEEIETPIIRSTENVPVSINVLEPKLINSNQPVVCLSEKELIERLNNRLLPHLTESVNGIVRVAVQKHTANLTFKLQKNLTEEVPSLVSEILNYNLKSVLAEIKRDLKFKK